MGTEAALSTIAEDGRNFGRMVAKYLRNLFEDMVRWESRLSDEENSEQLKLEFKTWCENKKNELQYTIYGAPFGYGQKLVSSVSSCVSQLGHFSDNIGSWTSFNNVMNDHIRQYERADPIKRNRKWHDPPRYAKLRKGIRPDIYRRHLEELARDGNLILHTYLNQTTSENDQNPHEQWNAIRPSVSIWVASCTELLKCISPINGSPDSEEQPAHHFEDLTYAWEIGGNHLFSHPRFTGACVELGIQYLNRLESSMENYIDSPSSPSESSQYSQVFNGPFYGQNALKIENLNSTIAGIIEHGDSQTGEALQALEQAIMVDTIEDIELQRDLLDNLETLTDAAETPPENRKRGALKAALSMLKSAASSGPEIAKALEAWGQVLNGLVT
ncbi:hypothetical protein [Nocardia sp. NPDC004722]